jgi:hypothetical protein
MYSVFGYKRRPHVHLEISKAQDDDYNFITISRYGKRTLTQVYIKLSLGDQPPL